MRKLLIILFVFLLPNIIHAVSNPDLLEGLEIRVQDPGSGLAEIRVQLGSCDVTYNIDAGYVLTNGSGPINAYKDILIEYDNTNIYNGVQVPGLLSKMGKDRLDRCLLEGKNYLKITGKDQARHHSNDLTWSSDLYNVKILDYSTNNKFIKVDNTGARVKLDGDLTDIAIGSTSTSCIANSSTVGIGNWKNFTLIGNIFGADPFGNNAGDSCGTCSTFSREIETCSGLPGDTNAIWVGPSGVDPNTGDYTGITCNGIGPIPESSNCSWGCRTGYIRDGNSCVVDTAPPINGAGDGLFILFDEGSQHLANYGAKLTNDTSTSIGRLESETCSGGWFKNFVFNVGGSYLLNGNNYPISDDGCDIKANSCNISTRPNDNGHIVYSDNPTSYYETYELNGSGCSYTCKDGYSGEWCLNNSSGTTNFCTAGVVLGSNSTCIIPGEGIPATCSDGIQNQNEAGTDCGGPNCSACVIEPTTNYCTLDATLDCTLYDSELCVADGTFTYGDKNTYACESSYERLKYDSCGNNIGIDTGTNCSCSTSTYINERGDFLSCHHTGDIIDSQTSGILSTANQCSGCLTEGDGYYYYPQTEIASLVLSQGSQSTVSGDKIGWRAYNIDYTSYCSWLSQFNGYRCYWSEYEVYHCTWERKREVVVDLNKICSN